MGAAMELTQLICDLEAERRPDTEFFLVYRKDTPPYIPKLFVGLTSKKFGRCMANVAINHEVGWPGGSNMLAGSAFIQMALLKRQGVCRNEAFLIFEPDCIPMTADWMDRLSAEWEAVKAAGKEAFGHWHQQGDETTRHMNGNAVFRTDFYDRHPQWIIGPGLMGWDYWFKDHFLPISRDSNLIFQHYNRHGLTVAEFEALEKNGVRPALFHGVKTADGRVSARESLLRPRLSVAVDQQ